jgi:protein O-mannosyl-transferase
MRYYNVMYLFLHHHWKKFLLLAVIGLIVYGNSLFNSFVWDDEEQLINNNTVHSLSNIPTIFTGSTFNSAGATKLGGLYYKPLMSVSFAFIYTLFGSHPFPFHFVQVLIHIINAMLVFMVLSYFLKERGYTLPLLLSILFLVHPINTEAVVYVSALQDVLFFCFGMLALVVTFYSSSKRSFWGVALICILLFFSLLSKETGIVFLLIMPIAILPRIIVFLTYLFFRVGMAGITFQEASLMPIMRASLVQRVLTIPKIILYYLQTSLFPKDLAISQHWVVTRVDWSNFYLPLILCFIVVGIIVGTWVSLYKKSPQLSRTYGFFFMLFWLGLGMHLQIIPLDMTVAERWFYLPFVGLLGMIGVVLSKTKKTVIIVALGLVILLLSGRTFIRNLDWKNGLTLFSHDIKISRNAFDLENNLGVELFRAGDISTAKQHFEASSKLAPYWWTNWNNLGAVYEQEGDLTTAASDYMRSIKNGDYYLAYENYAMILVKLQKFTEVKTFLEKEALPRYPNNTKLLEIYSYVRNNSTQ